MLFKSGFPKLPPESVYLLMLFTDHNLFDSQVWLETKVKWSGSVVSYSLWPPWTIDYQAPQSMGFSRQEYWSGLPCPSPGIEPASWTFSQPRDRTCISCIGRQVLYHWAMREALGWTIWIQILTSPVISHVALDQSPSHSVPQFLHL